MAAPPSSDIIDCVFTSLPDFPTLLSTILVSKSFHDVFQVHPSSILTSVAKTQIGPELFPCAIRLALFDRNEYTTSRASYVQDFPSERKFPQNEAPEVTTHVAAALAKNERIVVELELLFSTMCVLFSIHSRGHTDVCFWNRCKDRTSGTRSLLNSRESLRFRRAFYRWWLMINLFPAHYLRPPRTAWSDEESDASDDGNDADEEGEGTSGDRDDDYTNDTDSTADDTDDDDNYAGTEPPGAYIESSQGMRKAFLREFSDDEVAEMWQVHNFMIFASGCAWNAATQGPGISSRGSI